MGASDEGRTGEDGDAEVMQVLKLLAWFFLPRLIAEFLLNRLYSLLYRKTLAPARPPKDSPRYVKHLNQMTVAVIAVYLLYNIIDASWSLPPNYYSLFGMSPGNPFDLRQLKKVFRAVSLRHHPDKNPSAEAQDIFMQHRSAIEVLQHPLRRLAYNKFGSSIFNDCQHCRTEGDYIWAGLTSALPFHFGTAIVLFLLSFSGKLSAGRFWRWTSFAMLVSLELALLVMPVDPFPWFYPSHTISEKIHILHQLFWAFSLALSQIGPILFHDDKGPSLRQLVTEQFVLTRHLNMEMNAEYNNFFGAFVEDEPSMDRLKGAIHDYAVETALVSSPDFVQAVQRNPPTQARPTEHTMDAKAPNALRQRKQRL